MLNFGKRRLSRKHPKTGSGHQFQDIMGLDYNVKLIYFKFMPFMIGLAFVEILFLGVLFCVYLFLVHKLFFKIISNTKTENVLCSSCLNIYLMPIMFSCWCCLFIAAVDVVVPIVVVVGVSTSFSSFVSLPFFIPPSTLLLVLSFTCLVSSVPSCIFSPVLSVLVSSFDDVPIF